MKELTEKFTAHIELCQRLSHDLHAEFPLEISEAEAVQIKEVLELKHRIEIHFMHNEDLQDYQYDELINSHKD